MSIYFKNAGFKNTEEDIKKAFKRMIDGEVFRLGESKLYFTGASSVGASLQILSKHSLLKRLARLFGILATWT